MVPERRLPICMPHWILRQRTSVAARSTSTFENTVGRTLGRWSNWLTSWPGENDRAGHQACSTPKRRYRVFDGPRGSELDARSPSGLQTPRTLTPDRTKTGVTSLEIFHCVREYVKRGGDPDDAAVTFPSEVGRYVTEVFDSVRKSSCTSKPSDTVAFALRT